MGIPKFYRWLSERYPLINQPGGATVIPIIDNLYLDMNGIIHNCTHGNNAEVKLTEDEMIVRIFGYLDKLFHIVKPQKLLFMAIDGVAPRAKMNQQRARRFKSAREAEEAAAAAARKGEEPQDPDARFDSNCITPGTPFMARLGAHLRFFIRKKIAEDPAWQKPSIIFSGHDVPGEGEHKIMEYIRWARKGPNWAPNTRHCLYGLDADLVMLSLVTHEPHFNLLREVVSYTGGNRGQPAREVLENPCQEHFVLLQIGLLRDYLGLEFGDLKLPFPFDLERVVDDFVLFCMLVGNDFLPALPTVDIGEGSLDSLFSIYKELLPRMGGYLTFAGDLHRGRLELLLGKLAEMEADVLELRASETEEFENKKSSRRGGEKDPAWASTRVAASKRGNKAKEELDEEDASFIMEMAAMGLNKEGNELELLAVVEDEIELEATPDGEIQEKEVEKGPTMMSKEARDLFLNGDKNEALASWKARYYREKMGLKTEEERRGVVESYIQGLHWVLEYYYRGVASWNWFYPYHYAPMASDVKNLATIDVSFEQGEPFFPYEQLLAVQPASSYRLLPQPYQHLMREQTSPIVDFYPVDFQIDLEGKRADWEGVVLIPFIDQDRLLKAARSVAPGNLTPEERARNAPGTILVFKHDPGSKEDSFCESTLPAHFGSVAASSSKMSSQAAPPPLPAGEKGFVPQFVTGTKVGKGGPPGFPTLRTLGITGQLRRAGVNVFGTTSRKESVIVSPKDQFAGGPVPSAQQLASVLGGTRTWVKWPYLQEAVVEAVSDPTMTVRKGGEVIKHNAQKVDEWQRDAAKMVQDYYVKQGVDLYEITLLLHVRPCEGLVRQLDGTVEKRFAKKETAYPLQLTLRRNPAPDPRFQPDTVSDTMVSLNLKEGSRAVFLGRAHYGCFATVLPAPAQGLNKKGQEIKDNGTTAAKKFYRIEITPAALTAGQAAQAAKRMLSNVTTTGTMSGQVARRLGVSPRTLGRMTSNVWVRTGEERRDRVDIGLCIKNAKNAVYVPDYAVPIYDTNTPDADPNQPRGWAYTDAMIRMLEQYKQKFGFVWAALEGESTEGFRDLTLEDLFPGQDKDAAMSQLSTLQKWLKSQPLSRRPLIKLSSKIASEMGIKMLQSALPPPGKPLPAVELENVAPTLLLPPLESGGPEAALAGGTFELADRVVYVGSTGNPPFGSRGTVIAVHDEAIEVLFDAEFNGGTDLFGRCNGNYGGFFPGNMLLNLSKPHAIKAEGAEAPRVVRSSAAAQGGVNGSTTSVGVQPQRFVAGQGGASNPLAALAAASKGLQASGTTTASAAAAAQKAQQPKIPDPSGAKGFSMGRGKGLPPPPIQQQQQQPSPPPVPGNFLLAQLQRSPGAPPPVPPSQGGVAAQRQPSAGMALLNQLQGSSGSAPASPAAPAPQAAAPPPSTYGQNLLAQLQGGQARGGGGPVPPPQPAPGSILLQQLHQGASVSAQPQGQRQPAAARPGAVDLAQLWNSMQAPSQEAPTSSGDNGNSNTTGPPPMPPPPSSGLLAGADGSKDMDDFWDKLQQSGPRAPSRKKK